MKKLFSILALITIVNITLSQQRVSISRGYFTAKDYLDMTDTERRAYATGAVNGMLVAPFFGAPQDRLGWLKTCTGKLSDKELAETLTKYIDNDPSQLSQSLNVVTFSALQAFCAH